MSASEALKHPVSPQNLETLVANALAPAPLPKAIPASSAGVEGGESSGLVRAHLPRSAKSAAAFRTISEVAEDLGVPQHVLRFWETKFSSIRPLKRGGGRRYYRPEDVNLLKKIHHLLYTEGYTIKGAQKFLKGTGRGGVFVEGVAQEPVVRFAPESQDSPEDSETGIVIQSVVIEKALEGLSVDSSAPSVVRLALTPFQREGLQAILSELLDLKSVLAMARG